MQATEAAEKIREAAEETYEREFGKRIDDEEFRRRAAIAIGVLAMLLAIAGSGGQNATKETVNNNILASDTTSGRRHRSHLPQGPLVPVDQYQAQYEVSVGASSPWRPF